MRVLLCIDSLGIGGKERQAVELAKGLATLPEIACRVVSFGTADFYVPDLIAAGIAIDWVPRRARWDLGVFQELRRLIKTFKPDVIHTNGLISSFYALPLARRWRIPLVNGSIRNAFAEGGLRWTLERVLLKFSDYRVSNSHAGLRSRNFDAGDPRNVVIYNGFDSARVKHLNSSGACTGSAGNKSIKTVGMVAEFNPYKDYATFIEAARILCRTRQDVVFLTIGDGETRKECQTAAQGLDRVHFVGQRKDVEDLIECFDVGVLCSFVEGLSNSIMEYMALGKPVVVTDGGGTRELVVDGETGFVVRPSDPCAVAAAIDHFLEHPDVAQRMGSAGRAKLEREFSLRQMIMNTVALYRQAVDDLSDRNLCKESKPA